jgi:thiosulfate/3-mercaptopyruvate sulfurtransferase
MFTTIITAADLQKLLADPNADLVIFDVRHRLDNTAAGHTMYHAGHIPSALHVHLDSDLSGPVEMRASGHSGRHPLPDTHVWLERLGKWGVGPDTQVLAYDDQGGVMASRLWWMLRAVGHPAVAVLDGGLPAWVAAGGELQTGASVPKRSLAPYPGRLNSEWVAEMEDIRKQVAHPDQTPRYYVVDVRSPERYRGETEPYGPIAGHIPGSINAFYGPNLNPDGTFRSPEELRARFAPIVAAAGNREVVMSCGSGVSACHNLLAMEIAGLPTARLFPNSWSGWSATPDLPIAKGSEP